MGDDGRYAGYMATVSGYQVGKVLERANTSTGFLLSQLGHESLRETRDALADHGLKPRQLRILDLLADRGPIGQRELGELMAIDHSILVNMLNPLEKDRLVKRERDTVDRRRHVVTITAAGQRRLAAADAAFRDAEDTFFAALTQKQRVQLREILLIVRDTTRAPVGDDCV
jgi:DNA-binding MarR family transcriptional regulator